MDRMIEMKVSFDTDLDRAMEDTKVWAALALPGEQKMSVHDPREMESSAKEAEPSPTGAGSCPPTPTSTSSRSARTSSTGSRHLVFHFPGEDQEAAIARYGELMLPRLRERFGA